MHLEPVSQSMRQLGSYSSDGSACCRSIHTSWTNTTAVVTALSQKTMAPNCCA